jgi:hypothetical protein
MKFTQVHLRFLYCPRCSCSVLHVLAQQLRKNSSWYASSTWASLTFGLTLQVLFQGVKTKTDVQEPPLQSDELLGWWP